MRYYLAPMEGVTTWIFRQAYHACFPPMDKYFTPFLVPHTARDFTWKERNEILPEHNPGQRLVPQILTNQAEDFVRTAQKLKDRYGYEEVNLNLGCPSGTVVPKGRGAGFLADSVKLNAFLEEVFARLPHTRISIKTRLGLESPEEFGPLMEIYNQYPLEELIIHPRVRKDFYKNQPNLDAFALAYREAKMPLCYNGDLYRTEDFDRIEERFPEVDAVMAGRGILKNPGLIREKLGEGRPDAGTLKDFHDRIFRKYLENTSGDRDAIFKMKELWNYFSSYFPDSERVWKKIKKSQNKPAYEMAVRETFRMLETGPLGDQSPVVS